jgi:flagellar hook-associated protein 2
MATLSSAGIGSGLDVRSIVAQLMAVERRPLQALQASEKRAEAQLSAYGKLQSALGALRDASNRLGSAATWGATTVTSAKPDVVLATGDGRVPAGNYAVAVQRLASAQTLVMGNRLANAQESIGSGTLTIQLGRWDSSSSPPTFNAKAGSSPTSLRLDLGEDSLEAVRDRINGAGMGVTASVVNDLQGARLSLRSLEGGADNGFRVQVNDDDGDLTDGQGLSRLSYDPGTPSTAGLTRTVTAANALASINGVPVEQPTNALDDVIDGLSLQLISESSTPVDLSVKRDEESIQGALTGFATAYNDLVKLLREQTRVDPEGNNDGPLQGDSAAVGLLVQLRTLAGGTAASGSSFTRLSEIGFELQRDGTLNTNSGKLSAAMAKFNDLKTFFTADAAGNSNDGIGALFKAFADNRNGADGALSTRQEGLKTRIELLQDRQGNLERRLGLTEARLNAQYTRLDTNIASLNSLQNYVSQQVASWNRRT